MNLKRTLACIAVLMGACLLVAPSALSQSSDQAEIALEAAQHRQLVDGDLEAAIQLYKNILTTYGSNRPIAAKALLRMGECYEKLGQTEAKNAYERVLRDYSDQAEMVAKARARLAALTPAIEPASRGIVARQVWAEPSVDM